MRILSFVVFFILLFTGCGKRAEPPYKIIEIPPSFQEVSWLLRPEGVLLRWNYPDVNKVLRFDVMRRTDSKFIIIGNTNKQEFFDPFISAGRRDYKVVAMMRDGLSVETVFSLEIGEFPEPPEDVSFIINGDKIEIIWKEIRGYRYNIYKSKERGRYKEPLNKEPIDKPFYIDVINPHEVFYYTVRTVKARTESLSSMELIVSPDQFIPERPADIRFVKMEEELLLIWSPNKESWVRSYKVYRDDGDGYIYIGNTPAPLFKDKEYKDKKTIRYMIRAVGPIRESEGSIIEISR